MGGIASDGNIFNSNAVKLIDVPEMGYLTTDEPPRGEICVKNSEMINGYFKDPKVTAEKFVDGYFLTGDIGTINEFGKIKIIDRKKNIFKLSQGEFVSPESLENLYCEGSHFIHQIYVYGNSLHSNIVAVVVPDKAGVKLIAESLGVGDKGKPFIKLQCFFCLIQFKCRLERAMWTGFGEGDIHEGTSCYS